MTAAGFFKRLLGRTLPPPPVEDLPSALQTTQPMPRWAGSRLDNYELGQEIGRGAMAKVHQAVDRRSGGPVAIKRLSLQREFAPEDLLDVRERFIREASAAQHLEHPDILRVLDAGESGGDTWIAMELVVGHDLSHYTRDGHRLPLREVLLLGARLARALHYAHSHGVVHRDIKPANVMLDRATGSVKIMDFGIARVADGSRTRTGLVLGTPSYMSPEQLAGLKVDGRSDLYSLGVMLFQLLTGHLPHQSESMASLMHQIANQPAAPTRCPAVSRGPAGIAGDGGGVVARKAPGIAICVRRATGPGPGSGAGRPAGRAGQQQGRDRRNPLKWERQAHR